MKTVLKNNNIVKELIITKYWNNINKLFNNKYDIHIKIDTVHVPYDDHVWRYTILHKLKKMISFIVILVNYQTYQQNIMQENYLFIK